MKPQDDKEESLENKLKNQKSEINKKKPNPYSPAYDKHSSYETLDTKLSPEQADKYDHLKSILDPSKFYKNCMYCGRIYEGDYEKAVYQNGKGTLGREFNGYEISTGVCKEPECQERYQQQLDDIRNYKVKR
ncbi:MAG: hypothetical protein R6U52_01410 [Kosmotogaceae bacterium]